MKLSPRSLGQPRGLFRREPGNSSSSPSQSSQCDEECHVRVMKSQDESVSLMSRQSDVSDEERGSDCHDCVHRYLPGPPISPSPRGGVERPSRDLDPGLPESTSLPAPPPAAPLARRDRPPGHSTSPTSSGERDRARSSSPLSLSPARAGAVSREKIGGFAGVGVPQSKP